LISLLHNKKEKMIFILWEGKKKKVKIKICKMEKFGRKTQETLSVLPIVHAWAVIFNLQFVGQPWSVPKAPMKWDGRGLEWLVPSLRSKLFLIFARSSHWVPNTKPLHFYFFGAGAWQQPTYRFPRWYKRGGSDRRGESVYTLRWG